MTNYEMVREFHRAVGYQCEDKPGIISLRMAVARLGFHDEENAELHRAVVAEDIVEIADGICDLLYFAYGMAACYGLPIDRLFAEVHRSNMTKAGGEIVDGKLQKPDTYEPPELGAIIVEAMEG